MTLYFMPRVLLVLVMLLLLRVRYPLVVVAGCIRLPNPVRLLIVGRAGSLVTLWLGWKGGGEEPLERSDLAAEGVACLLDRQQLREDRRPRRHSRPDVRPRHGFTSTTAQSKSG